MKKCPFCGADIEDSARFCLYCMQPLAEKEQILLHEKKKPQWFLIIAAIVGILLAGVLLALIIALSHNPSAPDAVLPSKSELTDSAPSSGLAESHIHSYTIENTAHQYLQAEADCIYPSSYYYSCSCGEKGSDIFYWGEPIGHAEVADPAVAATCTATGLTAGKHCSVCNTVLVAQAVIAAKAHTEIIDPAVAPTCTATGLTAGKHCAVCNAILLAQIKIPVINHTFDNDRDQTCNVCKYVRVVNCRHTEIVTLPAVSPTCIASGLTEGKQCSICEEILIAQTPLAPLGHTEVTDRAIAATCTSDGKTEGKHCSTCNTVLVKQVTVAAKGHTAVTDPAVAATCTTTGLTAGKHCSVCNAVLIAQTVVGAKSHTEVIDPAVAPTCTATGLTAGKHCSVCKTVLLAQTKIPVINHTFDNDRDKTCNVCNYIRTINCSHTEILTLPAVSPTCTASGLTEGKQCSICEEILVAQTFLAPFGHKEVIDRAIAATCTADGKTEGKHCSVCNAALVPQVTVAAKGHAEVTDPAVAATCTATGLTEGKHCSVCNAVLLAQTKVPVKDHTFDNDRDKTCNVCNYIRTINCSHTEILTLPAVSPTCTTSGLTEGKQCSICEEILLAQTFLAPLGHTEVIDQAIAATCTTDGKTAGKHCAVCNTVLVPQATVVAKGHTEVIDQAVPATCTTAGKTEGIHCSVCQTVIKAQTSVKAFGHTIVVYEKGFPATCTAPGKTDGTICSGCGDLNDRPQSIPALGHVFAFGESSSSCLDCGAKKTLTVIAPSFPVVLRDTFRIDGGTYRVKQRPDDSWDVIFTFAYTNISSESTYLWPVVSLHGVVQAVPYYSSLAPNESGFFEAHAYVYDPNGTYYLVFE